MNNRQINHLNMYDAVEQVLNTTAFAAIWNLNPVMVTAVGTFTGHLSAINANDTVQKTSSAGTTQTKDAAQKAMAKAAVKACNAGRAYATIAGNTVLFDQMSHTVSEITNAPDTDADDICQNIHDNLNPYIALMGTGYGATATTQTALQNLINTYSGMIGKTAVQKAIVADATLTLEQHFTAEDAVLKNSLDTLMEQYELTNASFYNQYHSARVIHDIGHRKTVILEGFIYNAAGHAISGALVELTGDATHHKTTDATGGYKFTRLHIGTYTIKVSAAGYVTQSKTIVVKENGTVDTDFTMVAVGGTTGGGTTTGGTTPPETA